MHTHSSALLRTLSSGHASLVMLFLSKGSEGNDVLFLFLAPSTWTESTIFPYDIVQAHKR